MIQEYNIFTYLMLPIHLGKHWFDLRVWYNNSNNDNKQLLFLKNNFCLHVAWKRRFVITTTVKLGSV